MVHIVYWENIISQHKVPYWRQIALVNTNYNLTVVVPEILNQELIAQGWGASFNQEFAIMENPSAYEIQQLFENNRTGTIHVFSGIRANPFVFKAFKISLAYSGIKRVLLTESVNLAGFRSITRRLASLFIERKYRKYYDFVLASGKSTPRWYRECGFKKKQVFPFLYSIDPLQEFDPKLANKQFKMVFIGQLIKRKGIDLFLKSMHKLVKKNWSLDIYGKGELEEQLQDFVERSNLSKQVSFKGVLENNQMKQQLVNYDLLVLPSRFDGWGAVVNEALAAGVRVVCSSACGASVLINHQTYGAVFKNNNTQQLTRLVQKQMQLGPLKKEDRIRIYEYSGYLSGKGVATYLIQIMEYFYFNKGTRPVPVWEKV